MYKAFLHTHLLVVSLFILLYAIKTVLLFGNKTEALVSFSKKTRLFEIIISCIFLITGIFLLTQLPVIRAMLWVKIVLVFGSIPIAVQGFRKHKKGFALLSFVMILAAYALAEINHRQPMVVEAEVPTSSEHAGNKQPLTVSDGKKFYESNCVLCHGADGKLGLAGALDLTKTQLDEAGMKQVILDGRGAMPAAQVTPEQAAAIADYVRQNIKGK